MKIVLLGMPGAGKSTQGNLLSKQLHIPYLSTGHIFRAISQERTKWGRFVKETISAGLLIPDRETMDIVSGYLNRDAYKKGYILDGFPRNLYQAKYFENGLNAVLYLKVPDKEALWRIAGRNDQSRSDNTVAALKKRIEVFYSLTEPVADYYKKKGILIELDGSRSIKSINEYILKVLGKHIGKNGLTDWKLTRKVILAIVGLAGAGKTEAAEFFKKKKLPIISFSNIINGYIDNNNLKHTEIVHKRLRMEFRKKYGMEAMAVLSKDKIEKAFEENKVVIIEGLYSWEEYLYLQKNFSKVHIDLLAIYADKNIRYKRSAKRKYRKGLFGPERDLNELTKLNKALPIAYADHLVINNGSRADFFSKLEDVYREVYYGVR